MSLFLKRLTNRYQRELSRRLARRPFVLRNERPIVSFTFDDFPVSAARIAADILERHQARGTYYTSMGLMDTTAPTGEIFHRNDLLSVIRRGHEIGCHTYHHHHAYDTAADTFEQSIEENRNALAAIAPEVKMRTLSYPISCPRPATKRRCARHFMASRAGGQTYNVGEVDLEHLSAFFIEQSREDEAAMLAMIDATVAARGWLIFATHDVTENPTRYGCVPAQFERLVQHAAGSGAKILPVAAALHASGLKP